MDPITASKTVPAARASRWLPALGAFYVAIGLWAIAVGHLLIPGLIIASLGALTVWSSVRRRRFGPVVALTSAAQNLIAQGRYDEALALLDSVPLAKQQGLLGMAVLAQRASLLFARGDMAGAAALSAQALAMSSPLLNGAQAEQYRQMLGASRAVMLAAAGDADGARAEAARVDASPRATPPQRGLAALARAVTYARADDRSALAAELSRSRALFDAMTGREAVLARTLARIAASPAGGAYRTRAPRGGSELSDVGRWVLKVLPQATPFAPRREDRAPAVDLARLPSPTDEARARVLAERERARRSAPNRARWLGALAGLAIVAASALGTLAARGRGGPLNPWILFGGLVVMIAAIVRRNVGYARDLRDARTRYAEGRGAESDAALTRISRATPHLYASMALLELAQHAELRDDLALALAHLDAALGRVLKNRALKASVSDFHLPSIVALRARVLAAMGRTDDALAELELLAREHPTYAFATGATLLVRIVVALRLGDRALARSLADARGSDTNLPRHGELLVALLLGEVGVFEADGERERIEAELAANPGTQAWIERIAPGLTTALRASSGVRVVDDAERGDADERPAVEPRSARAEGAS